MPDVIPLGEFVNDDWYPGYRPAYDEAPWATEAIGTFSAGDEARFWFLDFHWPRGFTPLGFVVPHDCHAWGTQVAAENLPLPPGRGFAGRIAGTHIYDSDIPVASGWEIEKRGMLLGQNLPGILANFNALWEERKAELEFNNAYFAGLDLADKSPAEIGVHLTEARNFHRRGWQIHFEIMYPLLANYLGFYGICAEFGIDAGQISKFLQGDDTKVMAADRALWALAAAAREAGLEGAFAAHEAEGLGAALAAEPGAGPWRTELDAFLAEYGWRTAGIADPNLAPWIEDPSPVLGNIKTFLTQGAPHDFEASRAAAIAERDDAIDAARSRLTVEEQRVFDGALAGCQAANFAWWNEEHNHYIDMRISIPIRRAAMALARSVGADDPDDAQYCFWPELMALARGERPWTSTKNVVTERRDYYHHWLARRPEMPKVLGTIPGGVPDPIAVEIFGMHHHFFEGLAAGGDGPVALRGVPASAGTARGRARVLHDATQLHNLQPGEVLVCEATSPSWTPAFAKIAACVCDGGGSLTHASIVSREYRIPCVVGVGRATGLIKTGDEVEVDGTTGTVKVVGPRQ